MPAQLRTIKSEKQQRQEDVVEMAREILAKCESGEFVSIAAVGWTSAGVAHSRISAGVDAIRNIGALEILKWDLQSAMAGN